jgi:hypothetical protein
MVLEVLDVVAVLPPELHRRAIELSGRLAGRMAAAGGRSHFLLGESFTSGQDGVCEPHVSLFMLAVARNEIADVVQATREAAAVVSPLTAEGEEYGHNPAGAPELYFRRTAEWGELQRAVIASVEPLRHGRLPEFNPEGVRNRALMDDPRQDPARRDQLARFGYDEVSEERGGPRDRFNPHVTLAWPEDPEFRVELTDLPPASEFSGLLTHLAVYGMNICGTCTTAYDTVPLGGGIEKGRSAGTPFGLRALTQDRK